MSARGQARGAGVSFTAVFPPVWKAVEESETRRHLFAIPRHQPRRDDPRGRECWLKLAGITRNNLDGLDVAFPIGAFTSVTGVSGSGKSSLVSQALVELVAEALGQDLPEDEPEGGATTSRSPDECSRGSGRISGGMETIRRLVRVDQKPIGRTPRSNLATYTGLFDHVRKLFAATKEAKAHRFDAGRFSFNVAKGRCGTCEGEGQVMVELLFPPERLRPLPRLPRGPVQRRDAGDSLQGSKHRRCPGDDGRGRRRFLRRVIRPSSRSLEVLREVGLGYLRLGQSATELSGGEAQRIKLATELQRAQRGDTLYVLDEPTTGLHPSDVDRLMAQLDRLVNSGNTVIVVEHEMRVVAGSDWVIDIGPGAGDEGGKPGGDSGRPEAVARSTDEPDGHVIWLAPSVCPANLAQEKNVGFQMLRFQNPFSKSEV